MSNGCVWLPDTIGADSASAINTIILTAYYTVHALSLNLALLTKVLFLQICVAILFRDFLDVRNKNEHNIQN